MKKLCDNDLPKVSLYDPYKDLNESEREIVKVLEAWNRKNKESMEQAESAIIGFGESLILDPIEFAGELTLATSYGLRGKDPAKGYYEFNRYVNRVRRFIEDNVPDKNFYYGGKITGGLAQAILGAYNIINGASKLTIGEQISSLTGGEGVLALSGTNALAKSFLPIGAAVEEAIAIENTNKNAKSYSEARSGENETPKPTGGSGENISDVNKSKEILLNKEANYDSATKTLLEEIDKTGSFKNGSNKYIGRLKSSYGYEKQIGRESLDGKVRWRLDYDDKIGVHYNIEDFSNGKGINAVKKVIPIDISYNDYKKIIDLWN